METKMGRGDERTTRPQTEAIDKLFLELSQFTRAETACEGILRRDVEALSEAKVFILIKRVGCVWAIKRPVYEKTVEMLQDLRRMHPTAEIAVANVCAAREPYIWIETDRDFIFAAEEAVKLSRQ